MKEKFSLVYKILLEFYKTGLLEEIILIGSWCLFFYKEYFKALENLSLLRTTDIDFLVPDKSKIKKNIDIPSILKKNNFDETINLNSGWAKYSNPDLELEFLTPKLGKGIDKPVLIKKFNVNAVSLRYLNLLQDHIIKIKYSEIELKLPEPAAYSLHKFIISQRRKKSEKKEKDLRSAVEIGEFLLKDEIQKNKMIEIFNSFPKGWQKTLMNILKTHSKEVYELLCK